MQKLNFLVIYACLIYSVAANCKNGTPTQLQAFTINLDLEPSLRFQEVATVFSDGIKNVVNAQK